MKTNYQQIYIDLQKEVIDLLADKDDKNREVGLVLKEIIEKIEKKQEKEYFD